MRIHVAFEFTIWVRPPSPGDLSSFVRRQLFRARSNFAQASGLLLRTRTPHRRRSDVTPSGADPFGLLPDEVLVHILLIARDCPSTHWGPGAPCTPRLHGDEPRCSCRMFAPVLLSHVCKRWYALVLDHPQMWTILHVNTFRKTRLPMIALQRSQAAMLDVNITDVPMKWNRNAKDNYLNVLLPCTPRMQTLHLYTADHSSSKYVRQMVHCQTMPHLRKMAIESKEHSSIPALADICAEQRVPFLRHLVIIGTASMHYLPNLTNVTVLELFSVVLAPQTLKSVLDQAPQLMDLHYGRVAFDFTSAASAVLSQQSYLPALRTLKIWHDDLMVLGQIMKGVVAPNLQYLHVYPTNSASNEECGDVLAVLTGVLSQAYASLRVLGLHVIKPLSAGAGLQHLCELTQTFSTIMHLCLSGPGAPDMLYAIDNLQHITNDLSQSFPWPLLSRLTVDQTDFSHVLRFARARAAARVPLSRIRMARPYFDPVVTRSMKIFGALSCAKSQTALRWTLYY